MSRNNTFTVRFRRRREGITDYRKRLKILKSEKPRLIVRKSLSNVVVQFAEYGIKGDKVLLSAHSKELAKLGWNGNRGNIPAAYLTGLLAGKKALKKSINEAVLDIGLNVSTKGSRIYAALKGAIDAGLKIPCNKDILPDEKRIKGAHISDYAKSVKDDDKKFAAYRKNNVNPADIEKMFDSVKAKIEKV